MFGGPGVGKSTLSSGLFYIMKTNGYCVEYVTEQAKSFTWEERYRTLECQPYVFAKQMRDIWRLRNKVDFVICDSPLILSCIYGENKWPKSFFQYVIDQFNEFDNINFVIERSKPYVQTGRNESEDQARKIDEKIVQTLDKFDIRYYSVYRLNGVILRLEALKILKNS